MHIPTVKVKSPGALGYRIINQADLKPHHDLWTEQDADFTSPAGTGAPDATLVEIAVRIADKLLASKLQVSPVQWVDMPLAERVEQMLVAEREIDEGIKQQLEYRVAMERQLPPTPQPTTPPVPATAPVNVPQGRDADAPPPAAPVQPVTPPASPKASEPGWKATPPVSPKPAAPSKAKKD